MSDILLCKETPFDLKTIKEVNNLTFNQKHED